MSDTPRFATERECASLAAAELIRNRYPDAVHAADDSRKRTVLISESTPPRLKAEIDRLLLESWSEDRSGQTALTAHERSRIDFTQTNVMHARSCKAIAYEYGVDDWTAYYDETLSVDEHRELFGQRGGGAVTMRDIPYTTHSGEMR